MRTVRGGRVLTSDKLQAAERLLARLVARAVAVDHPELFPSSHRTRKHTRDSGPSPAARAEAAAPAARGDGLETMELEHGQARLYLSRW